MTQDVVVEVKTPATRVAGARYRSVPVYQNVERPCVDIRRAVGDFREMENFLQ